MEHSIWYYIAPTCIILGVGILIGFFFKKIEKLEQKQLNHDNLILFHRMYMRFLMEPNLRKKFELASWLKFWSGQNFGCTVYIDQNTPVNTIDYKTLTEHLNILLAQYLLEKINGMNIGKTIHTLSELHESIWSTGYGDEFSNIFKLVTDQSDFGFLKTLQEIYGAEHTRSAMEKFTDSQRVYDGFAKKYRIQNYSISNNFNYIAEQIEKRGEPAVQQIALEWIGRGGHPSGLMYRRLQNAIETGYGDDDEIG
jgi:hypothetical protein